MNIHLGRHPGRPAIERRRGDFRFVTILSLFRNKIAPWQVAQSHPEIFVYFDD